MKGYYEVQNELRKLFSKNAEAMRSSRIAVEHTICDCIDIVDEYFFTGEINSTVAEALDNWLASQEARYIREFLKNKRRCDYGVSKTYE